VGGRPTTLQYSRVTVPTYLGINISCGEGQEEHVTCVRVKSLAFFSNQHRLEATPSTPKHCLQTHVFVPSFYFVAHLVALNPKYSGEI